jgi:hypothetical protein
MLVRWYTYWASQRNNNCNNFKDGCLHLAERILLFLKNISVEIARLNLPIPVGSPTALQLDELVAYVILSSR